MSQTGNLPLHEPEHTIGHHVIWWVEQNLKHPDGSREPFKFTPEQRNFVLWFYAVDAKGKWVYRTGALRRSKGWGKSPLLAVISLVEFMGPCRFWKFHAGEALGKSVSSPWVRLAAVAIHQTKNTMDSIRGCLVGSPLTEQLDIGKTIIQFKDGRPGDIAPVTSNSQTLEGGRPTFTVMDETHHWTESNGGVNTFSTLKRDMSKNPGGLARFLETTNAYSPNQNSVAQKTHEAFLQGARGLLYDCVEAREMPQDWDIKDRANEEQLRELVTEAYGDATWVDVDSLLEEIYDPRTSLSDAYRFYLNQIRESLDDWMPKPEWTAILSEGTPVPTTDKRKQVQISIGFDGSLYHDSTAIVGCEIATGKLFMIGIWEHPDNNEDWSVPVFEVEARMKWAKEHYEIVWAYCDESYWQNVVGRWALEYKWGRDEKDCFFAFSPQRPTQMASAVQRFAVAVKTRDAICHDGNEDLQRHILNTHRRETPHGDLIWKEHKHSKKKMDAAICAVLAYEARADALADGRMKVTRGAKLRSY